jgi:hypothetical protein
MNFVPHLTADKGQSVSFSPQETRAELPPAAEWKAIYEHWIM